MTVLADYEEYMTLYKRGGLSRWIIMMRKVIDSRNEFGDLTIGSFERMLEERSDGGTCNNIKKDL
jgi:hypothetical protein